MSQLDENNKLTNTEVLKFQTNRFENKVSEQSMIQYLIVWICFASFKINTKLNSDFTIRLLRVEVYERHLPLSKLHLQPK